jgi:ferredoxin-type protein NapF
MRESGFDPGRRRFLTGRPAGNPPPWAEPARFHNLCTRCGACAAACPEVILVTADAGYPSVDFGRGECTFCGACAEACPEPIFASRTEPPWTIVAAIGEPCLALHGIVCQSCRDACPTGAIRFELAYRSAPRPRVDTTACTGCGACVAGCPASAITVAPPAAGSGA